ncbi:MAG: SDR family oxidoreductase [Gammaproteobacteria bacterium]|nr:SDR family oxidoreductase [Gammaproteobacteria bacterium]MDH3857489.1 SDR family oxidoreductase [Gammaproteobacteria bacterium]
MSNFDGKVAFITGAGGGMGYQIACDLIDAGASVLMFDIKARPDEIPGHAEQSHFVQADLTDDTAVAAAVEQAVTSFGGIDYLANVAGALWFDRDRSALEIDLDVWDQVMAVNLKSMVHTARQVVPCMRTRGGGAMVHFSSTQCLRGDSAPQDAYQAAKAGVVAFSKSLAIQLAGENIRSNVIFPGPSESPMQDRWKQNPDARAATANAIPLGRVGTVADMSNACLFLLSDKASFITGTELLVDGGLLAKP